MDSRAPRQQNEKATEQDASNQAANPADTAGENAARNPAAEQIARLQAEKNELTQTLVRRQADFENYRKRVERDRHEEGRRAVGHLLGAILPVLDAFERGLRAHDDPAYEEYRKGLELIYRQLIETLTKHGLERIAAAGETFNPHVHQAVERVETLNYPDGTVVDVMQDGYLFNGRVLRPSMVRVAVHPDDTGDDESSGALGESTED